VKSEHFDVFEWCLRADEAHTYAGVYWGSQQRGLTASFQWIRIVDSENRALVLEGQKFDIVNYEQWSQRHIILCTFILSLSVRAYRKRKDYHFHYYFFQQNWWKMTNFGILVAIFQDRWSQASAIPAPSGDNSKKIEGYASVVGPVRTSMI
jgi:hypothetical protein